MNRKIKQRVRAEVTFKRGGTKSPCEARLPAAVRDHLGGKVGDKLVFDEGCERAVTEAALKGRYFVVRLERPTLAVSPAPLEEPKTTRIETLAEAVTRKLSEVPAS